MGKAMTSMKKAKASCSFWFHCNNTTNSHEIIPRSSAATTTRSDCWFLVRASVTSGSTLAMASTIRGRVQYFGENNANALPAIDRRATDRPTTSSTSPRRSHGCRLEVPLQHQYRCRDVRRSGIFASARSRSCATTPLRRGLWLAPAPLAGLINNAGNERTLTDTNAVGPEKFYRVKIKLPYGRFERGGPGKWAALSERCHNIAALNKSESHSPHHPKVP